jgi:pimeloyl-ACP methyl ester carboxylesterase
MRFAAAHAKNFFPPNADHVAVTLLRKLPGEANTASEHRSPPKHSHRIETMKIFQASALALAALFCALVTPLPSMAQNTAPAKARNVVLVHGAYADGSSWSEVIPLLQEAGLRVTSVQNPLTSFKDDVDATKRILALQDGPTVLVGHSYAGMVISETGVDPKVSALVYVAARAPDAGEDYPALAAKFPAAPAGKGAVRAGGFVQLSEEAFIRDFAGDLPPAKARALHAVQGHISETLFASKTTEAAWRSKPSFYAISRNDRTTAPELQRFVAERMKATTIELDSSHVSLISHPREIADLILRAAGHTKKQ